MNTRNILMVIGATMLGSCSTMYKSGPTPDDVYFSPAAPESGYVAREDYSQYDRGRNDDDGYVDMSDRYLRMKSSSRRRWSTFDDDFMYWNNPMWNNSFMFNRWSRPGMGLSYGFGPMSFGNPFMMGYSPFMDPFMNPFANPYAGMGSFHNFGMGSFYGPTMGSFYGYGNFFGSPFSPYYYGTPVVVVTKPLVPVNPRANGPRIYNLGGYGNSSNYQNSKEYNRNSGNTPVRNGVRTFGNSTTAPSRSSGGYINTDNSRPRGGYNNNDNPSRGSSNPVRTFESNPPSRSSNVGSGGNSGGGSGASSSGSSSGSAPVRSFPRGGGN